MSIKQLVSKLRRILDSISSIPLRFFITVLEVEIQAQIHHPHKIFPSFVQTVLGKKFSRMCSDSTVNSRQGLLSVWRRLAEEMKIPLQPSSRNLHPNSPLLQIRLLW